VALTVLVAGASVVVDKTNADEVIASASSGACPVVVVAGDVIDVTVPVVSAVATLPKKSVVVASIDSLAATVAVAPLLGVFVPPVVGLMLAVMTEAVTVAAAVVVTRVVLIVSAVDTAAADDDAVVVFIAAMLFAI